MTVSVDPMQVLVIGVFGAFIGFVAGLWIGTKWEERRWSRSSRKELDE